MLQRPVDTTQVRLLRMLRYTEISPPNSAMGHKLPRRVVAGAADLAPITDTNAASLRDRFGPRAIFCTAEKRGDNSLSRSPILGAVEDVAQRNACYSELRKELLKPSAKDP